MILKASLEPYFIDLYLVIGVALGLAALQDGMLLLVETGNLGFHGSCTVVAILGWRNMGKKKKEKQLRIIFSKTIFYSLSKVILRIN